MNDKILHGLCSMLISYTFGVTVTWLAGALVALAFGLAKEGSDLITYDGWCWKDLLADVIGIVAGTLLAIIIGVLGW